MQYKESSFEKEGIDDVLASLITQKVYSNKHRCGILYLLRKCEGNRMKAESIARRLGISHRTALYHLGILEEMGFVEVKEFRRMGNRLFKSVWGITEGEDTELVVREIENLFGREELESMVNMNRDTRNKR